MRWDWVARWLPLKLQYFAHVEYVKKARKTPMLTDKRIHDITVSEVTKASEALGI